MSNNKGKTVELDVRPHLKKKLEPFQIIMETVKTLDKDDVFVLHATFKPTPLLGLLRTKGFVNKTEKRAKDHWVVTFVNKKNKAALDFPDDVADRDDEKKPASPPLDKTLDNRGLEPPQPMIRTLSALDRAKPGDKVRIHNDRVPVFLIEELNKLGYPFTVDEQPDGTAKVTITKV